MMILKAGTITAAALVAAMWQQPPATSVSSDLDVLQVRPNFFMIARAGGNIGVQVGPDGAVVVDAGSVDKAPAVIAAIKKLSDQPIRYVIDSGPDADHVGGNEQVAKAGRTILNVNNQSLGITNGGAATVVAAERVLFRMSAPTGEVSPFPAAAWPTETFFEPRRYMYFNDEGIEILQQPAAHTDGDSVVFFRRSDVVVAGDIIDTRHFPVVDVGRGGSIQGEIDALNRIVELAIPSIPLVWKKGGTKVIPGHGYILSQLDVAHYRDMVTISRDRTRHLISRKMTLDQVKAAAPTQGFTRRYGADSGPWTTNAFVEAVYSSLVQK